MSPVASFVGLGVNAERCVYMCTDFARTRITLCSFDQARLIRQNRILAANGIDPSGEEPFVPTFCLCPESNSLKGRSSTGSIFRHAARLQGRHPTVKHPPARGTAAKGLALIEERRFPPGSNVTCKVRPWSAVRSIDLGTPTFQITPNSIITSPTPNLSPTYAPLHLSIVTCFFCFSNPGLSFLISSLFGLHICRLPSLRRA